MTSTIISTSFDLNIQTTNNDPNKKNDNKLSWNDRRKNRQINDKKRIKNGTTPTKRNNYKNKLRQHQQKRKPSSSSSTNRMILNQQQQKSSIISKTKITIGNKNYDNNNPTDDDDQQHQDEKSNRINNNNQNNNSNDDNENEDDNDNDIQMEQHDEETRNNNKNHHIVEENVKEKSLLLHNDDQQNNNNNNSEQNDNCNTNNDIEHDKKLAYYSEFHARPYELDQKSATTKKNKNNIMDHNHRDDDNNNKSRMNNHIIMNQKMIPIQKVLSAKNNKKIRILKSSSIVTKEDEDNNNNDNTNSDSIKTTVDDVGKWNQFKSYLNPNLLQIISKKYEIPTIIQTKMIHAFFHTNNHYNNNDDDQHQLHHKKNIIMQSETGSGKTIAYLLPILQSIIYNQNNHNGNNNDPNKQNVDNNNIICKDRKIIGTQMIIICPTRELVLQTMSTIQYIIKHCNYYWMNIYCLISGYEKRNTEKAKLRKGISIIIATPGRLLDHLLRTQSFVEHCFYGTTTNNTNNTNNTEVIVDPITKSRTTVIKQKRNKNNINLKYIIFDEADRYFDDSANSRSVNEQIKQIISILKTPRKRVDDNDTIQEITSYPLWNCILVSATMTSRIKQLANDMIFGIMKDNNKNKNKQQMKIDPWIIVHGHNNNENNSLTKNHIDNHDNTINSMTVSKHDDDSKMADNDDDNDDETTHNKAIIPVLSSTTSLPNQLQHYHVLVSAKLRLPTLIGFLLDRIVTFYTYDTLDTTNTSSTSNISTINTPKQQQKRTIIFVSTCAAVDYYYSLFSNTSSIWNHENKDKNNDNKSSSNNNNTNSNNNKNNSNGIFGPLCTFYKLHGNMAHNERQDVMNQFLNLDHRMKKKNTTEEVNDADDDNNVIGVLFTTDVSARGLNLHHIDWIIQYDPPSEITDYIHRAGRVARAGNVGYCLLFLLPSEREYLDILIENGIPSSIRQYPISLTSILNTASMILTEMKSNKIISNNQSGGENNKNNIYTIISAISQKKNRIPNKSSRSGEDFCYDIQNQLEETVIMSGNASKYNNKNNDKLDNNSNINNRLSNVDPQQLNKGKKDKKKYGDDDNNDNNNHNNKEARTSIIATTNLLQMARNAFLSHIRAYPTKEKSLKHIFTTKSLHLGHIAKSFALKDPPKKVGGSYTSTATSKTTTKSSSKNNKQHVDKNKKRKGNNNNNNDNDDNANNKESMHKRRKVEGMKFSTSTTGANNKKHATTNNPQASRKQLLFTNAMKLQSMAGMDG